MGIQDILKKIERDAKERASKIKTGAKAQAEKILEEANISSESIKDEILKKAKTQAIAERNRSLTMANLEARKGILETKQSLMDETFRRALNNLIELPDKDYQAIILKLLLENVESGEEEIIISPKDKGRIDLKFLKEVNARLVKEGKGGKIKISSENRDFRGGFILRGGRKEMNLTYLSLIKDKRDELEGEVAKILFKG